MRVITASTYGGPEVLRVEERSAPQPQADDIVVEVKAAGVNLMRGNDWPFGARVKAVHPGDLLPIP
jgi:hypothetical protein